MCTALAEVCLPPFQIKVTSNAFKEKIANVRGGEKLLQLAGWKEQVRVFACIKRAYVCVSSRCGLVCQLLRPPLPFSLSPPQVAELQKSYVFHGDKGSIKFSILEECTGVLNKAIHTVNEKAEVRGAA